MKKLALALVCVASLAFFASCQKQGQPTITILEGEEYVIDGQTVDLGTEYTFGFTMASNAETGKALASLKVTIDSVEWANVDLTGMTEYTYTDVVTYTPQRDSIIGISHITAVVTDVAGETNYATITLNINEPAQPLVSRAFQWYRLGSTITGLDEFGLQWKGNYPKDTYAKLIPQDGVKLFIFESANWENVTTDVEKAALFSNALETMETADEYWNVNVTQQDMDYDDVIGTVKADGTCYLIHVTHSHSVLLNSGTETTITGETK